MRNPLHRLRSVGAKVVWIVAITTAVVVVAVSVSAGVRGYANLRQLLVESITAHSLIVASNSSAALAFGDREMAGQALSALRVVEGVEQALLIDNDGRVFAGFAPAGRADTTGRLYPPGHWRRGRDYVLVVPVRDRAGVHGRLQVDYSGARLAREATALALQSALLSLAATLLAWALARSLRPVLTTPVLELQRAAQRVRDTGDYSARARRISGDELGQLTDAFNEMLDRIETSRIALVEAQQRAEESSRLKDEFVATVSHELRTPLSPILAWIQILRMPRGAAQLGNGLDVMERNARALVLIIDDLLDMSRIVSGTLRLDVRTVDADAIVRAAVETLAHAAEGRQVAVDVRLDAPAPALRGDPARLQQVVWNLLSNAIKFSPPGSRVEVSTVHAGGRLDIVVQDRGMGIEPAFLQHVFDRFRQQDGSITRAHGGLGLGLAIVRQIVELHGGTVHASSGGPGTGARFVVSLPVAEAVAAATPALPSPAPARNDGLAGVRVLLVEDQADMRAIIRLALEDAGALVQEACTADEALERLAADVPDVLVSDIGLPDVDGYELLRRARAALGPQLPPAIALTAYVHPEERRRALEAGYRLHLSKPVEPAALVAAVAVAVAARGRGQGPEARG